MCLRVTWRCVVCGSEGEEGGGCEESVRGESKREKGRKEKRESEKARKRESEKRKRKRNIKDEELQPTVCRHSHCSRSHDKNKT